MREQIVAKQLMFYEKVAPISVERHTGWSLQAGVSYAFASEANASPLMCAEFAAAATELPIVFGKSDKGYAPVAILGIEQDKSLMVDADGQWRGRYIPAFVRRYPFVFAASEQNDKYTLCIDEEYPGIDETGVKGERLYDGETPAPMLERALEFSKNYEIEARKTTEFCRLLEENNLLDPMQAGIRMPDGEQRSVTGFHIISRDRLKEISDEVRDDFFKRDVLELVYYHLVSMRNMEKLRDMAA